MTVVERESDLIAECFRSARAMNAHLMCVGQRNAKGSGTTVGYPDLTLVCNGHVVLIECKRERTALGRRGELTLGQIAVIEKCAEQRVHVFAIRTVGEFEAIINACRRRSA